jgi:hypothetical protein
MYLGTIQMKNLENVWGKSMCGGRIANFSMCLSVFVPSTGPPTLEVTGDLDKEERRALRSGNDLGADSTGCDGGINERLPQKVFLASLSPPIFGETEVTRELD